MPRGEEINKLTAAAENLSCTALSKVRHLLEVTDLEAILGMKPWERYYFQLTLTWHLLRKQSLNQREEAAVGLLQGKRQAMLQDIPPFLAPVVTVLDCASNLLSTKLVKAESEKLKLGETIKDSMYSIERFKAELASARDRSHTSPDLS